MIQQTQLQSAYNTLYDRIAKYIWPFNTIVTLADLEVIVYTAFPDLENINRLFKSLILELRSAADKDADLKAAIEQFHDLISERPEVFIKIPVPMEVSKE